MPGVDILRRLLLPLRRHLRWAFLAGYAARTELFALDIVFGTLGLDAVDRFVRHHSILALSFRSRIRISASSFEVTISDSSGTRAIALSLLSSSSCSLVGFSIFESLSACTTA